MEAGYEEGMEITGQRRRVGGLGGRVQVQGSASAKDQTDYAWHGQPWILVVGFPVVGFPAEGF